MKYYDDAKKAAEGIDSNKWMWGNTDDPSKYYGVVSIYFPVEKGGYPNKPYFVVYSGTIR